jgi:hypothetical protein
MTVQCMSNLRTIMQAVQFYAGEYDGAMVPVEWTWNAIPSPIQAGYTAPGTSAAFSSDSYFLSKYTDGQVFSETNSGMICIIRALSAKLLLIRPAAMAGGGDAAMLGFSPSARSDDVNFLDVYRQFSIVTPP